jgi:hypothetical protein
MVFKYGVVVCALPFFVFFVKIPALAGRAKVVITAFWLANQLADFT